MIADLTDESEKSIDESKYNVKESTRIKKNKKLGVRQEKASCNAWNLLEAFIKMILRAKQNYLKNSLGLWVNIRMLLQKPSSLLMFTLNA